jgi:hypothetical protein
MTYYDRDTFTRNGYEFCVRIEHDDDSDAPWDREDGYGPVSHWTTRDKAPGEVCINTDHGSHRYYDVQAAMKTALADGWGLGGKALADFTAKIGRTPTKRMLAAEAVRRDCDRMRRWCDNEWCYVGVSVYLLDEDGNDTDRCDSLWGIESDCEEYIEQVVHELADGLIAGEVAEDRAAAWAAIQNIATVEA